MDLAEIRGQIDGIDSEIIRLLAQRSALVSESGKLKKNETEVRASGRVEQVIANARQKAASAGLDPLIAERIYRTIIDCFINKEMQDFKDRNSEPVKIYPQDQLTLKPNVPGAKMWAVGLGKAMLTYFEMEPNTQFLVHSHEAEQITLILEGELTFAYEGKNVTLKAGEVIAIPSNAEHSASTGSKPCKAVDAWSPMRKEFQG
jgi:chorismate mutase